MRDSSRPKGGLTRPDARGGVIQRAVATAAITSDRPGLSGRLPRPLDSLVGRDAEQVALRELLAQRRLVTLAGPAGVGKSRLATTLAWEFSGWMTHGATMVELAGVADPLSVPAAVATVLQVPETATGGPVEALLRVLAHHEILIVLDNCEHLIDAVGDFVASMLTETSGTRVLTTTREPLGINGEAVFRLEPLPTPDAVVPGAGDAIGLFTTRAREANSNFILPVDEAPAAVALVKRLDGLPLAIELVAVHASSFTTSELLDRLDSQPNLLTERRRGADRHRSLAAAVQWSDQLLTAEQRRVFYRLSVFAGGFSLKAAERVCASSGDISSAEIATVVDALVDKSLLAARTSPAGSRYLQLDTVRRYTAAQLETAGDAEQLRAQHLAWVIDLIDEAVAQLDDAGRARSAGLLEQETDNVRVALTWAVDNDPAAALMLATRLGRWWRTGGRLAEGRRWLSAAIAASASRSPAEKAAAFVELGLIMQDQVDVAESLTTHRYALDAATSAADDALLLAATIGMAQASRDSGDYAAAVDHGTRALEMARQLGDSQGECRALAVLAFTAIYQGDAETARGLGEQAARTSVADELSPAAWEAAACATTANWLTGRFDAAERHALQALTRAEASGSKAQIAWCHAAVGLLAGARRDLDNEVDHSRRSLDLSLEIGASRPLANALMGFIHFCGTAGNVELGAKLAGALSALLHRLGFGSLQGFDSYVKLEPYADRLGVDWWPLTSAYRAGQALSTVEAVELARSITSRGGVAIAGPAEILRLSGRERELVRLVADGLTDRQIAQRLYISTSTVHSHLDRIRDKTGARRRAELTRLAATLDHADLPTPAVMAP